MPLGLNAFFDQNFFDNLYYNAYIILMLFSWHEFYKLLNKEQDGYNTGKVKNLYCKLLSQIHNNFLE